MSATTAMKKPRPATDEQKDLLDRLLGERVHYLTPESVELLKAKANTRDMSAVIKSLLRQPYKPKPVVPTGVSVEPGVYKKDGEIYEIKRSGSGVLRVKRIAVVAGKVRRYAALLRPSRFTPADRITEDDATGFGKEYGICCMCFRLLTDLQSIRDGIGPVCKKKHFGR